MAQAVSDMQARRWPRAASRTPSPNGTFRSPPSWMTRAAGNVSSSADRCTASKWLSGTCTSRSRARGMRACIRSPAPAASANTWMADGTSGIGAISTRRAVRRPRLHTWRAGHPASEPACPNLFRDGDLGPWPAGRTANNDEDQQDDLGETGPED